MLLILKQKKSKWEIRTNEYFKGTPVIKDGVLLISSFDVIVAYDADFGTKIWEKKFNKFGTSSPTLKDDKVYVGGDGNLHALNYKNGKTIFEIKLNNDSTELGNPIVDNNAIFFNDRRGNIYRANGNTGTIEWSKKFCYYPAVTSMAISNGTLYGFCTATLYALNAENGEKKWSFTPNQNFNFLYAPEISNNKIYTVLTSVYGEYSIYQVDSENGKQTDSWNKTLKTKNPLLSTPELIFYISGDELIAINDLGEKVWTYKLASSGISLAPLVLLGNDGKTYYSSMTGMKN